MTSQITLIGPVFPLTGGIAQHNARLAQELEQRGATVITESWRKQYPHWLQKGQKQSQQRDAEVGLPSVVRRQLAWYSPLSWWRVGWRSRSSNVLVLTIPTAFHAIPYAVVLLAAGNRPEVVGIIHNVTPHEPLPGSRLLMKTLARMCNRLIVHSDNAFDELRAQTGAPTSVTSVTLPSPWTITSSESSTKRPNRGVPRLLFFGTVRPYKGLDLLLHALAKVPGCTLLVAGDFWEPVEKYQKLTAELGLESRVELRPGYVESDQFDGLFSSCDALVLPYLSGTGSIVRELAFSFGLPVLATRTGSIAETIIDGKNGLVVEPKSLQALIDGLTKLCDRATLEKLSQGVRALQANSRADWERYCNALLN